MGRRSRKRPPEGPVAPPVAPAGRDPHSAPRTHRARMDEAPPAPWSPFPLVELVVLLGLVLIVWAFVGGGDRRGTMLAAGVLLGALGGLELSVREHFAGFRSHSAILAGACTVLVAVPLYLVHRAAAGGDPRHRRGDVRPRALAVPDRVQAAVGRPRLPRLRRGDRPARPA